jgi:lysophospholipase L1-like esterase
MDTTTKEFILNLPLYDGIENIEIGIVKGFEISKSEDDYKIKRPIVFYGTSITQGGSASRPGLAYPSIISRDLNVETINLGFSGNGKFEKSVGLALCEIDAEIYVIDCVPNSSPEVIKKNAYNLIKQIRKARPKTPILLVESIIREYSYFQKTDETIFGGLKYIQSQNNELKNAYNKLIEEGIENVFYLSSEGLIGFDHEGTIDGTHLNDLGMTRIANKIGNKINEILEVKETTGANNVYKK